MKRFNVFNVREEHRLGARSVCQVTS